jgi:hypothetical protein
MYLRGDVGDSEALWGIPNTAGTSTFTIKVTSEGQTATKQFTITINPYRFSVSGGEKGVPPGTGFALLGKRDPPELPNIFGSLGLLAH